MTVSRMRLQPCSWSTMQYSMVFHRLWKPLMSRQVHHAKMHPVFRHSMQQESLSNAIAMLQLEINADWTSICMKHSCFLCFAGRTPYSLQCYPVMALQVSKDDLKKLFIHGIPPSAQPCDVLQLFEACTCACPTVEGDVRDRRGMLCH